MLKTVEFVSEFEDLSTDKGYQFKFHCDKCHQGYTSTYKPATLGVAAGLLETAGGVFGSLGSIFGKGKQAAQGVQETLGGKVHSDAYARAVEEVKVQFRHCSRCGHWVCVAACWNERDRMCEACAPSVTEESASARARLTVQQIEKKLSEQDLTKCAKCGADLAAGARFCGGCGEPVQTMKAAFCAQCGTRLTGERFCPSCGLPVP
jgi:hypothetical protein